MFKTIINEDDAQTIDKMHKKYPVKVDEVNSVFHVLHVPIYKDVL